MNREGMRLFFQQLGLKSHCTGKNILPWLKKLYLNKKVDKLNILENIYERVNTDYLDAERRIELHIKQLELAKKALRILESEYATDGKNFEEILRMERQVLMHNLELEKSRSDLNASIAFINYLMGK